MWGTSWWEGIECKPKGPYHPICMLSAEVNCAGLWALGSVCLTWFSDLFTMMLSCPVLWFSDAVIFTVELFQVWHACYTLKFSILRYSERVQSALLQDGSTQPPFHDHVSFCGVDQLNSAGIFIWAICIQYWPLPTHLKRIVNCQGWVPFFLKEAANLEEERLICRANWLLGENDKGQVHLTMTMEEIMNME